MCSIYDTILPMADDHKTKVANFYNGKKQDFDYLLAESDLIIHHHEGLLSEEQYKKYSQLNSDQEIMPVIHQLETELTEYGMELIEPQPFADQCGFDAGSGRGGSSIMIANKFGCKMVGVTISDYQAEISNQIAEQKSISDKVKFKTGDMTKTDFPDQNFDFIWAWGSTEHVEDLDEMFREFARIAKIGVPLLIITWLQNDEHPKVEESAEQVNKAYVVKLHSRAQYNQAAKDNGWDLEIERDHTAEIGRYWKLREKLSKGSGTESFMSKGFNTGALEYYLFRYRKAK